MKLDNWNTNTGKVRAWMSDELDDEQLKLALETTLALGDAATSDDARSTFWTALRSIAAQCDNFPKARVGQASVLSTTGQLIVATAENQVRSAFASIPTEYHAMLLTVGVLPHGRTGGVYANWDEACDAMAESAHNYMMKSVKEERWNGEKADKAGVPDITPRPTQAERDDASDNNEGGDTQDE